MKIAKLCVIIVALMLGLDNASADVAQCNLQQCQSALIPVVQVDTLLEQIKQMESKVLEHDKELFQTKILAFISVLLSIMLGYIVCKKPREKQQSGVLKEGDKKQEEDNSTELVANIAESSVDEIETVCNEPPVEKIIERQDCKPVEESNVLFDKYRKQKIVKFGTFLIDENGGIRTEQRVLTDDDSSHLFRIEYEEGADIATYTINPKKKVSILTDIQTFQNFTEKCVLTGTPTEVSVQEVGRLRKTGRSWIVINKLKVSFK